MGLPHGAAALVTSAYMQQLGHPSAHPGTMGKMEFFQSLWIWCRSEWQMPQYATSILTSFSPTGRRVKRNGARWPARAPAPISASTGNAVPSLPVWRRRNAHLTFYL